MRNFDQEYTKLYTALCTTTTAGSILRARLLCIMQRAGKTPTGLAVEMDRDRKTWGRKLNADHGEPRALAVEDIDAILEHLQLDPRAILRAVFLRGDRKFLKALFDRFDRRQVFEVLTMNDGEGRLARLRAQGLINMDDQLFLTLTRLGRAARDR